MKRIFTYGRKIEERNLTFPEIQSAKASGKKLSQAFAANADDAGAIARAGLDIATVLSPDIEDARVQAPNIYTIVPLGADELVTADDVMREAMRAAIAGADHFHTMRRMDIVEMLASEGFLVQGHVGLVPRKSIRTGGLRAFAKTAEEAVAVLDDIRRLEEAGAVSVEVECVAADAMAAISRHTPLITHGIGSGAGADVIFMFTEDICGDNPTPPYHAHAFGDLLSIRKQVAAEKHRALSEYHKAVCAGGFPDGSVSISMHDGEHEKLLEALDKHQPLHR